MLIVLVGARGAGKSTLLDMFKADGTPVLQPSTTRAQRNAADQEYDFVAPNGWTRSKYAWTIDVNGDLYGMRKTELGKAKSKTCVTVFEPINLHHFEAIRQGFEFETITVGLNTINDLTEQAQRVGGVAGRLMNQADFDRASKVVAECDLVLSGDAATIKDALVALMALVAGRGGVVTKDYLAPLMKAGAMLTGADLARVQGASYDLSIGTEILYQGTTVTLTDAAPRFELPPYSYAVVSARELANLPPCVVGRFDLKVSYFFEGIILSNGPQVDPGYKGALFCMLYNGSGQPKVLKLGNAFATIDFTTTTTVTAGYKDKHQFKQRIGQFLTDNAVSSREGITDVVDKRVGSVNTKVNGIIASMLGIAGLAISLPAITLPIMWDEISEARAERVALEKTQADAQKLLEEIKKERNEAASTTAVSPKLPTPPGPLRLPAPPKDGAR